MIENTPSFYAIIPADVRYDKNLKANAKLLYGEITALCNKEGYCWASNSYFAKLYEVSVTSISLWLKNLIDYGYLFSKTIQLKSDKQQRLLYIAPLEEKLNPPLRKVKPPLEEKLKHNNTYNNTYNKKTIGDVPSEQSQDSSSETSADLDDNKPSKKQSSNKPPNKTIKRKASKVLTALNNLAKKSRGFRPTDSNLKGIIARLNEGFSVRDCIQVIETKLQDPYFQANPKYFRPTTLFGSPTKFESYLNEDPNEYNIPKDGTNRSGLTGTNYDKDMEEMSVF